VAHNDNKTTEPDNWTQRPGLTGTFPNAPGCIAIRTAARSEAAPVYVSILDPFVKRGNRVRFNLAKTLMHVPVTNLRLAYAALAGSGADMNAVHHCVSRTCCNNRRMQVVVRVLAASTGVRKLIENSESYSGAFKMTKLTGNMKNNIPFQLNLSEYNEEARSDKLAVDVIEMTVDKSNLLTIGHLSDDVLAIAFKEKMKRTFVATDRSADDIDNVAENAGFVDGDYTLTNRGQKFAVTCPISDKNEDAIKKLHADLKLAGIEAIEGNTSTLSIFIPKWQRCAQCGVLREPHDHSNFSAIVLSAMRHTAAAAASAVQPELEANGDGDPLRTPDPSSNEVSETVKDSEAGTESESDSDASNIDGDEDEEEDADSRPKDEDEKGKGDAMEVEFRFQSGDRRNAGTDEPTKSSQHDEQQPQSGRLRRKRGKPTERSPTPAPSGPPNKLMRFAGEVKRRLQRRITPVG